MKKIFVIAVFVSLFAMSCGTGSKKVETNDSLITPKADTTLVVDTAKTDTAVKEVAPLK